MTEAQIAENLVEGLDNGEESEYNEDWTPEMEQRRYGYEAGENFINRHIIGKINLFLDVYRKKGYSDDFLQGFMDGISDTASTITFNSVESEESVENEQQSMLE